MGKDTSLLRSVSKLFTEETLREVLEKSTGEKDVEVEGWSFMPPAAKGDSYLSQVDRVTIHGLVRGKKTDFKYFIKSLPKNIGRRKTYRSADFFRNEIVFYTEILSVFDKFISSKGQNRLLMVPKCLAAVVDGENDFLVLEDVGLKGFKPVARLNTLNLDEMKILLKAMANFHAVSFAYKDQHPEDFEKLAGKLFETYFIQSQWNWYKNFHAISIRVAKDALAKEYPDHPATKKFNSYEPPKTLWDKSASFCQRWHAPTSVMNQGDSWAPNFLAAHVGDPEREQALLLDFQLARVASPVLDLAFLVYACSDKQLLDEHFDNMLKIYHDTLSKSIEALGSNPEKIYPWYLFEQEVNEQWVHGVNFAVEAVPFSMLDESEAFDLDLIKGDEAIDIADIWQVQDIKTSEGRRRLAGFIIHAHSRGFI